MYELKILIKSGNHEDIKDILSKVSGQIERGVISSNQPDYYFKIKEQE